MFQSTLPRGERRKFLTNKPPAIPSFNPRSRAGSDRSFIDSLQYMTVSIHAPARGATSVTLCIDQIQRFQSTLPRGERHGREPGIGYRIRCFNPRSRAGSDRSYDRRAKEEMVFQSTLPRGERRSVHPLWNRKKGFNPRSRAGSDP